MSDVLTADGRIIHIRPVHLRDAEALRGMYESAGPDSRHFRFFSLGTHQIDEEVARLTRERGPDHHALIALDGGVAIGAASYERLDDPATADFAVLVADPWHGRGVGTLLVEELCAHAKANGIHELQGDVLPANTPMLRVAAGITPHGQMDHEQGITKVHIATTLDATALEALDARERAAEERSLRPLLAPRSVAVVGAGRQPGGIGREVLSNILGHGYTGRLYAVNPNAAEIDGCMTFSRVSAIPESVDLVIVAVPAPAVAEVLRDAGATGVRGAVVLTAGFSETGGTEAQRELLAIARKFGMRLIGPNCLGVLNTDPAVRLAGTFASDLPEGNGGLAVATQSGAVGIAVLDHAAKTGMGISTFVSLGNKADVSGNDLLSYWCGDPATRAVALYLESFGNPRKFARIARAVARRKPVLAVKGGRSADGQRAGASHTAAAAAPTVAVDALFAQAGVIRTDSLGEMLDAARMLIDQPLPFGNRVGVVGNAGGLNVLATDAAEAAGLAVPQVTVDGGNPYDLGAGATPRALRAAVTALAASGQIDSLVVVFGATRSNNPSVAIQTIAEAVDAFPDLPVAAVLVGLPDAPSQLGARRAPVYGLPEQAMRALGHATRYGAWRSSSLGIQPTLSDVDKRRARAIVDEALQAKEGWQPWQMASQLLSCYGIPVLAGEVADSVDNAVAAANRLRYPVVLKAADPDLVHKTELGVVRLGLRNATAVADAYKTIGAALRQETPTVIVQPMRSGGTELVAGVVHDPLFGSLLMTGLGGIHTDLLGDRSFQLLPLTDVDAAAMWRRLRGAKVLTGYRGQPVCDTAALEDLLLRLGRLAEDFPEIAELDLNPVLAFHHGVTAVDVKLRLSPTGTEPDATSRALRA